MASRYRGLLGLQVDMARTTGQHANIRHSFKNGQEKGQDTGQTLRQSSRLLRRTLPAREGWKAVCPTESPWRKENPVLVEGKKHMSEQA